MTDDDEEEDESKATAGVDWYRCSMCPRNFREKNGLLAHRKEKHGKLLRRRKRQRQQQQQQLQQQDEEAWGVVISEVIKEETKNNNDIPIKPMSLPPSSSRILSPPSHDDDDIQIIYETNPPLPPKKVTMTTTQKFVEIIELDDDEENEKENILTQQQQQPPSSSSLLPNKCEESIKDSSILIVTINNEKEQKEEGEWDFIEKFSQNGKPAFSSPPAMLPVPSDDKQEETDKRKTKKKTRRKGRKPKEVSNQFRSAHCCQNCKKYFVSTTSLADHNRFFHQGKKVQATAGAETLFSCKKCDESFQNCMQLLSHKSKVHHSSLVLLSSPFSHCQKKKSRKRVSTASTTPIIRTKLIKKFDEFCESSKKTGGNNNSASIEDQVEYKWSTKGLTCVCKICKNEFANIYKTMVHIESSHYDAINEPNNAQQEEDDKRRRNVGAEKQLFVNTTNTSFKGAGKSLDYYNKMKQSSKSSPLNLSKKNPLFNMFSPGCDGDDGQVGKSENVLSEFITPQIYNDKNVYVCRLCCKVMSYLPLAVNHVRIHNTHHKTQGSKTVKDTTITTTTATVDLCPPPLPNSEGAILKTKNSTTTHDTRSKIKGSYSYKASGYPYISLRLNRGGGGRNEESKKTYSCNFCKAIFGQPSKALSHVIGHTGERPFECTTCQQTFSRQSTLRAHERRVHRNHKVNRRRVTKSSPSRLGGGRRPKSSSSRPGGGRRPKEIFFNSQILSSNS